MPRTKLSPAAERWRKILAGGAHASATLFTLIKNANANGLEPYAYLRFLFENLNGSKTRAELAALLPQFVDPSALKIPLF